MRTTEELIYAGTHGNVVALDKASGETVWQTSLPGTGYDVVAMVYEDDTLFCATGGHVFALDPATGDILWENGLKGLHYGVVFLTTMRSTNAEAAIATLRAQQQNDASSSSSSSTHRS